MAYLEFREGFNAGMVFYINDDTTIGRSPENDLCLPDSHASRKHAMLRLDGRNVQIVDLQSGNGTYINDVRLSPEQPHLLKEGDIIRICATELVFHDPASGVGTKKSSTVLAAVMTPDDHDNTAIGATIDASQSMIDLPAIGEQSPQRIMQTLARLQAMVKVSNALASVTGQVPLLEKIMHSIFDIFPNADRAFVMLPDTESGDMAPFLGRNRHTIIGKPEEFSISSTIVNMIVQKRQSILSSDAQTDKRFGGADSVVNLRIRSMMAAPLTSQDEILGILHVDTMTNTRAFTRDDLEMLTGIAAQAGVHLKNAELYEQVQEETERRTILSRYTSPDIVQRILEGKITLDMSPRTAHGTVMFSDIIGFTPMSEHMPPVDVIACLNRYYRLTTRIVAEHNGTLHKFGGDMVMAFWNVMFEDVHHERNAVRTGLNLQTAIWQYDLGLLQQGHEPIHMSVGLNTGSFAAGDVGGQNFVEYTVIGDHVNTAQRIESVAGRWQVFVSASTYGAIREEVVGVELPPVTLRGRSTTDTLYSIRGIADPHGGQELCLPVSILLAGGTQAGQGILVHAEGQGKTLRVRLLTGVALQKNQTLALQFQAQEIPPHLKIGAHIASVSAGHDGHTEFWACTLDNICGNPEALLFFTPGATITCPHSWEQMRRG